MTLAIRSFLLSCTGPLDANASRSSLMAGMSSFLPDPRAIQDILMATPASPQWILPARSTLADARALDKALLGLGIVSHICYVDAHDPRVAHLFVDQREGTRRSAQHPVTPVDQRSTRGRRALDAA
jgi:hypothetical protein